MNNFIEMDYDEWFDTFKPIPNHIDKNASFGDGEHGYMFETYGDELKYVQELIDDNRIWTLGDGDDGGTYIWNGYSFVNRIGYFITDVAWVEGTDVQVLVSEPEFCCDDCQDTFSDFDKLIEDEKSGLYLCSVCAAIDNPVEKE